MKKKLKIAVLIHKGLLPPDDPSGLSKEKFEDIKVEYQVISTLKKAGHEIYPVEMFGELEPLRMLLNEVKPDIAFNLIEEFYEFPFFDHQVISYLELKKIPYTGCNPRGMFLAKDKALSKKILAFHNINIPDFYVFRRRKKIKTDSDIRYPLFIKSLSDEGSIGITTKSVVNSEDELVKRIKDFHNKHSTDVIAEEFITGREIYVGVLGNEHLNVFTPWELILENVDTDTPIATSKLKWDAKHQKETGLVTKAAKLPAELVKKFKSDAKTIYKALHLSGYARIDFRLSTGDMIYLLEANPNPFIAMNEDFADSAKHDGIKYPELLDKIIRTGLRYKPFR